MSDATRLQPPDSRPKLSSFRKTLSYIRPNRAGLSTTSSRNSSRVSLPLRQTQSYIDPSEEYVNPLEEGPRWVLSARAAAIRSAASIGFGIMNISAIGASKTIWLNSTLGKWKGKEKIKVEVWYPEKKSGSSRGQPTTTAPKRPAVINFHGGGFVLGQATDDAYWAGAVMKAFDAVVFSVNYRLAPDYPFPTAVEDCADAILQIARRSEEFGIDTDRIIISGFSAGGTLSLASWNLLQDPQRWGYQLAGVPPKIAGFALFYPLLDWTISRPRKRLSCVRPDLTLAKGLTDLFDASYIYPRIPKAERDDPRLSPGLMPDEALAQMPPIHMCICEYDMLLAEGHRFANRLKVAGKEVTVRVVKAEKHAWDKPPPMWPKPSVHVEYGHTVDAIRRWIPTAVEGEESDISK
ncbi:Alpha/Beta hydrolase protein [Xylariales sp. AK1849]|nr:Alpha/Beta hydrolase protein [Xylariales sp. AK1849]